jgi:hypothetical protein
MSFDCDFCFSRTASRLAHDCTMQAGPRMLDDRVCNITQGCRSCLLSRRDYPMQSVVIRTPRHTVPTGTTAASLSAEPTAMAATVTFFHSRGFAVTTEGKIKTSPRARVFIGPTVASILSPFREGSFAGTKDYHLCPPSVRERGAKAYKTEQRN